ncbi:MAG TPA: hypothetical protein VGB76_00305 [Pyrinomonadaceae bacterium]
MPRALSRRREREAWAAPRRAGFYVEAFARKEFYVAADDRLASGVEIACVVRSKELR